MDGRIVGRNVENGEIAESINRFDILANVAQRDGATYCIVHMEAQKDVPKEYHLMNRAEYYIDRIITSQKGRDFYHMDYNEMKQVHSIWLCMNAKENTLNHMTRTEEKRIGDFTEPSNSVYNVYILRLTKEVPKKEEGLALHRFLITLLSDKVSFEEKYALLKEYGLVTEESMERVKEMCNLSELIGEDREAIGFANGFADGEAVGFKNGKAIGFANGKDFATTEMIQRMFECGLPLEQIANITKKSPEEIQKLLA